MKKIMSDKLEHGDDDSYVYYRPIQHFQDFFVEM